MPLANYSPQQMHFENRHLDVPMTLRIQKLRHRRFPSTAKLSESACRQSEISRSAVGCLSLGNIDVTWVLNYSSCMSPLRGVIVRVKDRDDFVDVFATIVI
jgi:hypothetical protein